MQTLQKQLEIRFQETVVAPKTSLTPKQEK
jgi:hypothetical protein